MEKILKSLNQAQLEAVKNIDGPMLILAGAGSGKTKTITSRLAYLIALGIDPANTLTLTFTNKAANEMRTRALSLLDSVAYPPLLCTFHKFGLLFLKFHIDRIGRKNSFVLIDSDDKKKILKELNIELPLAFVENEISRLKNLLIDPESALLQADQKNYKLLAEVYQKYENYLKEKNLVDFDDLLMLSYKILDLDYELAKEISRRYLYIMVDEYQDTNELQFKLLQKLCSAHQNICVVGDDDQSIYSWRGANIRNILEFSNHFKGAKIVKLEKNYRSSTQILKIANELISHNKNRLGKELISAVGDGPDVVVLESSDENEEALKIAKKIRELLDIGVNPGEIAILFRLNALSRSIEDGLNKLKIPYRLVGTIRFYERMEVKDLISYFRIIVNPHDDYSLKRVINKPKRGVGKTTIEKLEKLAYMKQTSIYELFNGNFDSELEKEIGKKSIQIIRAFFDDLELLKKILQDSSMKFLDAFDEIIGFKDAFKDDPEVFDRLNNIDEVYGLYRDFIIQNPNSSLEDFLNEISLQSDQDSIKNDGVVAMSIHSSKGLEFEYLFVIGLEEGIFPILREGTDIEEERRLAYVAITRAKKELTLSHVKSRFYHGKRSELIKSRFLNECGLGTGVLMLDKHSAYKKGDLIKHKIFGIGRIISVTKGSKDDKLLINFGGMQREILASFVEKV